MEIEIMANTGLYDHLQCPQKKHWSQGIWMLALADRENIKVCIWAGTDSVALLNQTIPPSKAVVLRESKLHSALLRLCSTSCNNYSEHLCKSIFWMSQSRSPRIGVTLYVALPLKSLGRHAWFLPSHFIFTITLQSWLRRENDGCPTWTSCNFNLGFPDPSPML